jgi:sugar (pentulose or hexulose) kinase
MEVLLIFDIGKTNKKILLFNREFEVVHKEEITFQEVSDEDGFPCDDIHRIERWILDSIETYIASDEYQVKGINFSTYGATLAFLDEEGMRLSPIYNYLKPFPEQLLEAFYKSYGGREEFCRCTASPELGMLNSGLQMLWFKRSKADIFREVKHILHFPQYLAGLVHGQRVSEHTSIGCHTMLWDFDRMGYHKWLSQEAISLPAPISVWETFPVAMGGKTIEAGIGIHDSSAALAPYILAAPENFILISTGTWCINMSSSNSEPLTVEELKQDCLCFLGIHGKPVKSSRFFLGRIHDLNVERLEEYFFMDEGSYKEVELQISTVRELWESGEESQVFFRKGIPVGLVDLGVECRQFGSFDEAYTRLMVDLCRNAVHSISLILGEKDNTEHLYITGGFARNPVFRTIICLAFSGKRVFASEVDNASSLGAALVMADKVWEGATLNLELGLEEIKL